MSSSLYDSRAFVRRLTEAGMPEGQADTLANENLLLIAEHLATKDDLKALGSALEAKMDLLRTELRSEMSELRTELRSEMSELRTELRSEMRLFESRLESRLLVRLGGLMTALAGAIAALVTIF